MGRLFRFELRKLFRMKSLYISCVIIVILEIFSRFIALMGSAKAGHPEQTQNGIHTLISAIGGANINLFLAILVALIVCGDFSEGMAKTIIGRGYSRGKYFVGQFLACMVCAFILCLVAVLTAFVYGTSNFGVGTGINGTYILALFVQFLIVTAIVAIMFMFSVLCRKTSGAIVAGILIPNVASSLLIALDSMLKMPIKFTPLWIQNYMDQVSSLPLSMGKIGEAFIVAVIYIIIFVTVGCLIMRRRDV